MTYLLDTNIVSYILKRKNTTVENKLRETRRSGQDVFISCITYYEVKRGLLYANATSQLAEFNLFHQRYQILFVDDIEIIEKDCENHADLKRKGTPSGSQIELPIPQSLFPVLNQFPRILKPE